MLEHYIKAAKALDIDVDKIWSDMARALVREELTREERFNERLLFRTFLLKKQNENERKSKKK